MSKKRTITLEHYEQAREGYLGWCPVCNDFTRESTEPDATDYDCHKCHQLKVFGAETALVMGCFDIEAEL